MVLEEKQLYFVQALRAKDGGKGQPEMLSAIQLKRGLKKGQETYVAALIKIKEGQSVEVPDSVVKILKEFKDVMPAELPKELPPWRPIDHKIELLPGTKAPAQAPYRMPPAELLELRKQLKKLLDAGLIQPSRAPYGAPVLFQKKQDGSLRMCVDYRALNKVTIKNKYPIPLAVELFDRLSKASYFTKLDLRSGYWQVRIAVGDEGKTTCVTRYGSYEFLVMLFGLKNAPATFYNLMNVVLFDYLDAFVVVYLDDIVVYSKTLTEHEKHLRLVFQRLRENRLYVKPEKCEFAQEEITFLGHKISAGLIRMDKGKVQSIMEWTVPTKVTELRSSLAWPTTIGAAEQDAAYGKLKQQVKEGVIRRYWLEGDLLVAKGGKWYVPAGGLRKDLLRETHDSKWAGHPGEKRTLALLARSYFWPKMGEDVQAYVKSCLVCQMDKTKRKKAAGLL
ncbi:transposon Ty3-I Gag-Pol polyprotein [Vitis vinifera]|uniref:transposon Ty3-I Gag-Pol polyprotein n=1 Tax=Vitis vinifera TaxID=29760 RepID=UPI0028832BCD|nr:transposon Ty3-I Gag-Pol polyprotein [Vitis vinifera]